MHYRIIVIVILALIVSPGLPAGEPPINTLSVEQETARHALSGYWDNVIKTGKEALSMGIDFYNLRYRMGIAYYHQGNFHGAVRHLQKAYQINTNDPLLKEYLYWAYRYAGYDADARILAAGFSQELKNKARIPDQHPGDFLSLSFNTGFPVDKSFTDTYVNTTDPAVNGAQFLSKTLTYADLGFHKILTPRLSVYTAYARLKKTSYLYAQENGYAVIKPDYETHLNQVYLSGTYHVMQGTDLTAGTHIINLRYQRDRYVIEGLEGRIVAENISRNDGLFFLSLYHRFPYVTTGITTLFSNLNEKEQIQGNLQFIFYPLGNLSLYGGITATFHHQNPGKNTWFTEYMLGGKLTGNLWAEATLTTGDLQNATCCQGYVVYNGMDIITRRIGGRFIFTATENITLNLNYVFQNHESLFYPENTAMSPVNLFEYTSHSITGALQWNF